MFGMKKESIERIKMPRRTQDLIPVTTLYKDGSRLLNNGYYSKSYEINDINYAGLSEEKQKIIFNKYQQILSTFRPEAVSKITINNRPKKESEVRKMFHTERTEDGRDELREEYDRIIIDKATANNNIEKSIYLTVSTRRRNYDEAKQFFNQIETTMDNSIKSCGSSLKPVSGIEWVNIMRDFFYPREEICEEFDFSSAGKLGKDFRDYFVPNDITKRYDYMQINNKRYARALYLKGHGAYVSDRVINELVSLNKVMMVSIDNITVSIEDAVDYAEHKLMDADGNINRWLDKAANRHNGSVISRTVPRHLESQHASMTEFLDDLTKRDKRMFFSSLTIIHTADTLEELEADTQEIMSRAQICRVDLSVMFGMQPDGLVTTLPIGVKRNEANRVLTSEMLATFMPFNTSDVQHIGGAFMGINKRSGKIIIVNKDCFLNGNKFVIGISGSGKSLGVKLSDIGDAVLRREDDVIIIDPDNEYGTYVKALGGEVIDISSTSATHINAMDINRNYGDEDDPVTVKAEFVLSLYEQINDGYMVSPVEKSIISRCVDILYKKFGVSGESNPTLVDLQNIIREQPEDMAEEIAVKFELFTTGLLNVFAHRTNVDTSNRIMCYSTSKLSEQLRPTATLVIWDAIWNRLTSNRKKGVNTTIIIDEIKDFLLYSYSANLLLKCWTRIRKYGGFCVGITQNASSVLNSDVGETMFTNSELIALYNQKPEDCVRLQKLMNISDEELKSIQDVQQGVGLIKCGNTLIEFDQRIPTDSKLYRLITTKFNEFKK